jgi:hypothetical protein
VALRLNGRPRSPKKNSAALRRRSLRAARWGRRAATIGTERPSVASADDHARMLTVLGREQDRPALQTMQRVIELEHGLRRGLSIGR